MMRRLRLPASVYSFAFLFFACGSDLPKVGTPDVTADTTSDVVDVPVFEADVRPDVPDAEPDTPDAEQDVEPDIVCEDVCEEGESRCEANAIELCAPDEDGCLSWTAGADCALDGELCLEADRAAECVDPTCDDGRTGGDGSGIDCGGEECPACEPGRPCRSGSDCTSGVCAEGLCAEPSSVSTRC